MVQKSRKKLSPRDLNSMDDEELLSLRFRDLPVRLEGTQVYRRVKRLYAELKQRDLKFAPHVWLSDEWFALDGIPGIAIPFYLAHPRLAKLEQKQMLEVEGAGERECMKILRHEAGHAIDSAFRLHFRSEWRKHFGHFSKRYPDSYRPKPNSRRYVLHLNNWYAQSHPAEDFAETFAVWLTPNLRWRHHYEGWPAIRKLEFVERLMLEIAGKTQPVKKKTEFEPLSKLNRTLREHYKRRKAKYISSPVDFYTYDLKRLFSDDPKFKKNESAARFILSCRAELRGTVAYWTGTYRYTVDQVLERMTERARELKLRLMRTERETRRDLDTLVTVVTMNLIHSGRNQIAL